MNFKLQVFHAGCWFLRGTIFPETRKHRESQNPDESRLLTDFVTFKSFQPKPTLWSVSQNHPFVPKWERHKPQESPLHSCFHQSFYEVDKKLLPFSLTVFNPLFHDGMKCFQVHGDIFLIRVKHVAQLFKTTIIWSPTSCMSQILNYLGNCYFS